MDLAAFNARAVSTLFVILLVDLLRDAYHWFRTEPPGDPVCEECLEEGVRTDSEMFREWECPSCGRKMYKDRDEATAAMVPERLRDPICRVGRFIGSAQPFSFFLFLSIVLAVGILAAIIDTVIPVDDIAIGTGFVVMGWMWLSGPLYAGIGMES